MTPEANNIAQLEKAAAALAGNPTMTSCKCSACEQGRANAAAVRWAIERVKENTSLRGRVEGLETALREARDTFNQIALARRTIGPIATQAQTAAHKITAALAGGE